MSEPEEMGGCAVVTYSEIVRGEDGVLRLEVTIDGEIVFRGTPRQAAGCVATINERLVSQGLPALGPDSCGTLDLNDN